VPLHAYQQPRVSPDGSRLAVYAADQDADLWLWELARPMLARLTFTPGSDYYPVWGPDGRRLFFSSDQDGVRNLYVQAADGTGTAERLTTSPNEQYASEVTPDGTRLLFAERSPQTGFDIMQVELTGTTRAVTPLVQTPAEENNGVVSPDGRWLAYEANDSGTLEIYVRPYPDVASGQWQVSTAGGLQALWARDGRELFYVSPAGALMRVGVEGGPSWTTTPPMAVLKDGAVLTPAGTGRQYDVSPDGQRFLVAKDVTTTDADPPQLIVIQHFDALLQRLVPGEE